MPKNSLVGVPIKLKLTIRQINDLRSFMKIKDNKREYCRALAVHQKTNGKTYDYIVREHRVHLRTAKKLVGGYIKNDTEGLKIKKDYVGETKPRITDNDKEIILSALFNDPHTYLWFS